MSKCGNKKVCKCCILTTTMMAYNVHCDQNTKTNEMIKVPLSIQSSSKPMMRRLTSMRRLQGSGIQQGTPSSASNQGCIERVINKVSNAITSGIANITGGGSAANTYCTAADKQQHIEALATEYGTKWAAAYSNVFGKAVPPADVDRIVRSLAEGYPEDFNKLSGGGSTISKDELDNYLSNVVGKATDVTPLKQAMNDYIRDVTNGFSMNDYTIIMLTGDTQTDLEEALKHHQKQMQIGGP